MSRMRWIFAVALAAVVTSVAHAGEPARLDKAEVEKALSGKTMNYSNINGSAAILNFEKDGRLTYKTGNSKAAVGTWEARDDGRYCIKMTTGSVPDHCRGLWKTDTGYAIGSSTGELIPVGGLN